MLRTSITTLDHHMQLLVASTQLNYRSSCFQGFSTLRRVTCEYLISSGISNARKCAITTCRKHTRGDQAPTSFEDKDRGNCNNMVGSEAIEVPEMVDAMGDSSGELHHQEELLNSDYETELLSKGFSEVTCSSDASRGQESTEALSSEEIRDRWDFLRHLPHKLLRDIGYVIVGPSLLLNSCELPTVSLVMLGASREQWFSTKTWLQQLSIPAVEAWFASQRPNNRLGDHFALCIEYVLRHSPVLVVQRLHTSQQVLQRVTEPVRTKAWKLRQPHEVLPDGHIVKNNNCPEPELCLPEHLGHVRLPIGPVTLEDTTLQLQSMDFCDKNTKTKEGGGEAQEKLGKRKRKLLRKLERIRLRKGKTTTIGEFDFLFESPQVATRVDRVEFQHWEVSVKYLLYAGPWEAFGVKTPQNAVWSNREVEGSGEVGKGEICDRKKSMSSEGREGVVNSSLNDEVKGMDEFLGCFLGPHVGETLFDRKARLRNQLALSSNPCAALMLQSLYFVDKPQDGAKGLISSSIGARNCHKNSETDAQWEEACLKTIQLQETAAGDNDIGGQNVDDLGDNLGARGFIEAPEVLNVLPSALLKGYLFYEYKLWRFLETKQQHGDDIHVPHQPEKACLNTNHWMGWWTRDISEFTHLPRHQRSMWYIVPKLEWLSPILIPELDTIRCAQVHCLDEFVGIAKRVADEAAQLQMPRKRRFLVAELCWESNWPKNMGTSGGAWLEVSRGFVVEDSWPVTKLYRPHGYVMSWSPTLQGQHLPTSTL